jgi:hypothetical protein
MYKKYNTTTNNSNQWHQHQQQLIASTSINGINSDQW